MNLQDETKHNDGFVVILFFCIILSLIPVLCRFTIAPELFSGGMYSLSVGVMFILQMFILSIYYLRNMKAKYNKGLYLIAWVFAAAQASTLLASSLKGIEIDNLDFINMIARLLCIFMFFYIPSTLNISNKGLETFMNLIVFLGLTACAYSMIVNFNGLTNILSITNPYAVNFKSFYGNKNSFAQLLLFSLIANTILFARRRSFINGVTFLIFSLNIVATLSRTVLAAATVFIFVLSLLYFRKWGRILLLFVALAGIWSQLINFNSEISDFIISMLIRPDLGTAGRSDLWLIGLKVLRQSSVIFGMGYLSSANVIGNSGYDEHEFHNFYIETLTGGGLLDLALHAIIIVFLIWKIKSINNKDKNIRNIYISSYVALAFYAMFESASFFTLGYVSTIFTVFYITIPFVYANHHPLVKDKINVNINRSEDRDSLDSISTR